MSQSSPCPDERPSKVTAMMRFRSRHSSLRLPRQKALTVETPTAGPSSQGVSPVRARRSESSSGAFLRADAAMASGGGSSSSSICGGGGGRKSPSPGAGAFLRIRSFSKTLRLRHQKSSESHDSTVSNASSGGVFEATADNMELLNTKNNGAVDDQNKATADQNASIKGLWKWAFSSLRKDKPAEQTKDPTRKGRKNPKGQKPGDGDDPRETDADIDPVYHLLKCAANKGQYCATCGGPKQNEAGTPIVPPNSGCSSPASASSGPCAICNCPCHSPHRIPSITTKDIAPQRKKGRSPQPSPTGGTPGSFKGSSPMGGPTLTISLTEDDY